MYNQQRYDLNGNIILQASTAQRLEASWRNQTEQVEPLKEIYSNLTESCEAVLDEPRTL